MCLCNAHPWGPHRNRAAWRRPSQVRPTRTLLCCQSGCRQALLKWIHFMGKVGGVEETNIFWKAEQCLYFSLHIHFFPLGLCISKKLPFLSLFLLYGIYGEVLPFKVGRKSSTTTSIHSPYCQKRNLKRHRKKEGKKKNEKRKSPKYTAVAIFLLKTLLWIHHLRIVFWNHLQLYFSMLVKFGKHTCIHGYDIALICYREKLSTNPSAKYTRFH